MIAIYTCCMCIQHSIQFRDEALTLTHSLIRINLVELKIRDNTICMAHKSSQ